MKWLALVVVLASAACGGGKDGADLTKELEDATGIHVLAVDAWTGGRVRVIADIEQAVDHDDPASAVFLQRLVIYHLVASAPMVLGTEGYDIGLGFGISEPTSIVGGNEVQVEHRFFGSSLPTDWSKLTIAQAAADHHHVVETLARYYSGPWISTGASKGGVASLVHRRFFPDDVAGTVAYVAPFSQGLSDQRYVSYVHELGVGTCGTELRAFQKDVLTEPRRADLADALAKVLRDLGLHYALLGTDRILEHTTVETPFTFWQYGSTAGCGAVPDVDKASNSSILAFIDATNRFSLWSDEGIAQEQGYWVAVAAEEGYPADEVTHLDGLLRYDGETIPLQLITEVTPPPTFDQAPMQDVHDWVANEGRSIVLVYGARDPWTAGAFTVSGNDDTSSHLVAGGNHGSRLQNLDAAEREPIVARLHAWVGQ